MSSIDKIDRALLYLLVDARKHHKVAETTWSLASQQSKSSIKRNRVEGIYRYHLRKLVNMGLVLESPREKGDVEYAQYYLNPKKVICTNGALILLSSSILIFECPYNPDKCPVHCKPRFYKPNGHTTVKGSKCRLMIEASPAIQKTFCEEVDREEA